MNRKSVETFMKKAMDLHAPENIWDRIKDQPIQIVQIEPQSKKSKNIPYALIASTAACLLLVSILAVHHNGNPFSAPPIASEPITDREKAHDDHAMSTQNPPDTISTNSGQGDNSMGVAISIYKVWDHRLYQLSADSGSTALSDADLEELHREIVNGVEMTAYSFKNIPMEQSIGDKRNGMVLRYDCIYNGVFNIQGKKYGIVDTRAYFYPEPEKGAYIGQVEGMKVYEFIGNKEAVLIDLAKYINVGDSTDEFLYVAELLS